MADTRAAGSVADVPDRDIARSKGHQPGHAAIRGLSRWVWFDRSVRTQLLGIFVLMNLAAGLAAAIIVIYNGRQAIEAELMASVDVAERLVRGTVDRLASDPSRARHLEDLVVRVGHPRHVQILLADTAGAALGQSPSEARNRSAADQAGVPRWFQALVRVDDLRRDVPVVLGGQPAGTIIVLGQASDEIIEIWRDVSGLALLALILNAAIIGVLYVALGRVLHPLASLAAGLRELEQGHYRHRLRQPAVRELADITAGFNALADSLAAARTDNARLNRQLVTVQDDERRQIAMELHDELGPCLFGVRANVASIDKVAGELPETAARRVGERVASLVSIVDRMQVVNRDLVGRLRPMALGHVALAEAVAGLVANFEGSDPDRRYVLQTGRLARSYGSCIDLTVFRCLQEGITNAARHADARTIDVTLGERLHAGDLAASTLLLAVEDDGSGIAPGTPPGQGRRGMEERVRALGGRLALMNAARGGTRLEIELPLDVAEPAEAVGHGDA